ncbi:MAG TPA: acyl-CoA dehydrogenase family protein [Myxococcota bacterium]|nr:acyl-CoA dehydrogenase family protein [Myxococcota bacterium]
MAERFPEPPQLLAARALAPEIRGAAAAAETARTQPAALIARLAEAGLMGICVPRQYGGSELAAADVLRVIEEVSQADGATGWCVMIGATTGVLAAFLPEKFAREIYAANPRVITGGGAAPIAQARAVAGGHEVTGRWPFGSGCLHCDWLVGGSAPDAAGESRLFFFARDQVRIHDTWHAGGLRGSGSHDFEVTGAFVPEGRSVKLPPRPVCGGPLYLFPTFGLLALGICAVTLGIARRAIDELVTLAGAKVPTGSARKLASHAVVQRQVGEAEAALRSARAYVYGAVDAAWQMALSGESFPVETLADLRLAAVNAAWSAARAVDLVYHAAGGSSVYDRSPLSRCFRDIHVATQHIMVAQPIYEVVGRVTLGLPTELGSL